MTGIRSAFFILAALAVSAHAAHPDAAGIGQVIHKRLGCSKWNTTTKADAVTLPGQKFAYYMTRFGLATERRNVDVQDYLKEGRKYEFHGQGQMPERGAIDVAILTDEGRKLFSPERKGVCTNTYVATRVIGWTEPKPDPDGVVQSFVTYEWRNEYLKPEWEAIAREVNKNTTATGTHTIRVIKKNGVWTWDKVI